MYAQRLFNEHRNGELTAIAMAIERLLQWRVNGYCNRELTAIAIAS
jgi:hypothetical protein